MKTENLLPAIDAEKLQTAANEAAMKGAIAAINDFYTGYDSPYKKGITAALNKKKLNGMLELPDIIAVLNESLVKEIDAIANTAIAQSYIPQVKKLLTRADAEVKFTDILKEFVQAVRAESTEDCELYTEKHEKYHWLTVKLSGKDKDYEFTLHEDTDSKKEGKTKYTLLSLPWVDRKHPQNMKITIDGATIEMPFQRDILKDDFIGYLCRLVIARSVITIDSKEFDDDMFPERCHCD